MLSGEGTPKPTQLRRFAGLSGTGRRQVLCRSRLRWFSLALVLWGMLMQLAHPLTGFALAGRSTRASMAGGRTAALRAEASEDSASHLDSLTPGDRLVGWLKHPVLTKREKWDLVIEVGPGEDEGTWRIEDTQTKLKVKRQSFEGPFKIKRTDSGLLELVDAQTSLFATLNGDGPGTLSGVVSQGGLTWEGFFSSSLAGEEEEEAEESEDADA
mmetsp:Transcript_8390/g.19750  ORF Transcript_8390/g.19750 Transcript_8390/m.19750 type:complete len:213 (-) Transcript_8390:54-692(-)